MLKPTLPFILALACYGQITRLATTDDGGQVYFTSSQALKGQAIGRPDTIRVFRYVDSGLEQFAYNGPKITRPASGIIGPAPDAIEYCCDLGLPSVTGDGRKVAYSSYYYCSGSSHCPPYRYYSGYITTAEGQSRMDGRVELSPNGRYILLAETSDGRYTKVVDAETGITTNLSPYRASAWRQSIASDGSVLATGTFGGLFLSRSGIIKTIDTNASYGVISANASVVAYLTCPNGKCEQLICYETTSGRSITLGTSKSLDLSLSVDGSTIAYLDSAVNGTLQVHLQRTDGTGKRILTTENGGISEFVMSGFGNVVYAIGEHGRLLRVDTATLAVTELAKPAPGIQLPARGIVPGQLLTLWRDSLYGSTGLIINGRAAPLITNSASTLTFQVPWETAAEQYASISASGYETPFEDSPLKSVVASFPIFYFLDSGVPFGSSGYYVAALHQDFKSIVSPQNPASAGEIIHVFLTGLGPVSPPIATGVVTSGDALYRAIAKVDCSIGFLNPVEVLFAGLSPGFVGVNQLDLRLPDPLPKNVSDLYCGGNFGVLPMK